MISEPTSTKSKKNVHIGAAYIIVRATSIIIPLTEGFFILRSAYTSSAISIAKKQITPRIKLAGCLTGCLSGWVKKYQVAKTATHPSPDPIITDNAKDVMLVKISQCFAKNLLKAKNTIPVTATSAPKRSSCPATLLLLQNLFTFL